MACSVKLEVKALHNLIADHHKLATVYLFVQNRAPSINDSHRFLI